ncbi:MAG: nodulation protein NfeD [Bacteroidales bacterium]|jgi:membrane-bound serine protease (ClpP class)|nr:nodulation protein NfeD [Bacteroidales bacterium]
MTCVFLRFKKIFLICLFGCLAHFSLSDLRAADESPFAEDESVYVFDMMDEIGPATWRTTMQSINRAVQMKARLIIIHMNTYGGLVDAADSIRTKILNCPIPVYVFVDNNAISAGALIAVACDKIYMREGASIGAATVVNQTGEAMPDKYQSFMRSMMRATAMAHGKDTIINGKDTVYRWRRDPNIAQAMVDPTIVVKGLVDSTKLLTMTVEEAISVCYCEGKATSIEDILAANDLSDAPVTRHVLTPLEKVIHFLINPYLHSLLIMLIIGGIYFEFQTPGIGFPLAVSVIAALLYFAPLFLEGIANHWELALFIVGLLLIGLEIFALPGFGVAGISGIILMVLGISLAMVDNIVFEWDWIYGLAALFKSVCLVVVSAAAALGLSIWAGRYFFENTALSRVMLQAVQKSSDGYISFDDWSYLVGVTGTARSVLRPAGKVEIDGKLFDAMSETGFINAGDAVKIIRFETGQLYVVRTNG